MKIHKLQFITNQNAQYTPLEQVLQACKSSCKWIQLRLKNTEREDILGIATEARVICEKYNCTLIINDDPYIAKQVKAHGVHLGKDDMNPTEARVLLGDNFIIGATANTISDIRRLKNQKVDYIGLGPFRFTSTKKNLAPILNIAGYDNIIQTMKSEKINIPIIAIGGIRNTDIKTLFKSGVSAIAISSAIANTKNISKSIENIHRQIDCF